MSEKYLINEEKFREQIVRRILLFQFSSKRLLAAAFNVHFNFYSTEFNTNNSLILQKLFSINLCSDKNKIEYVSKN